MREHAEQERFICLARAEESDVRLRRGWQQSAKRVQGFCANHRSVNALGIFRSFRVLRAKMRLHGWNPLRVRLEGAIQRANEPIAERRSIDLSRHVIFP